MSGWDQGNIHYSDQQLVAEDGAGEGGRLQPVAAQQRFRSFIRSYSNMDSDGYLYRDMLRANVLEGNDSMEVLIDDLLAHDQLLADMLAERPAEYLPLFEAAATEIAAEIHNEDDEADMDEAGERDIRIQTKRAVHVRLNSTATPMKLRNLSSMDIGHLIVVPGIIIGSSKIRAKATQVHIQCKTCNNPKVLPAKNGFGSIALPRTCEGARIEGGRQDCGIDPFVIIPDKCTYVDQQQLKMQEHPEEVPTGEMPRSIAMVADRSLVQQYAPGTRVHVIGIYDVFSQQGRKGSDTAIRTPYIQICGMHVPGGIAKNGGQVSFTSEEEAEIKEFAQEPGVYEKFAASIAPSIFGHDDVKKAIACLLMSGCAKQLADGMRLRGDINVLLLGDPSTAKSQFLKFTEKVAPVSVYTSGKGSSAAGLTASVIKDPQSGEFYLEGGAMVLADGGVVCIDEFDKMRPDDRVAIHEAMEQQTISIAKAGITTVLNSRTSVLAAANPVAGRYDDMKTASEQIEMQTTILSRFDLIFIVRDEHNVEKDLRIARHVVGVHVQAGADKGNAQKLTEDEEYYKFLKRYVQWMRQNVHPRLSPQAAELLGAHFVDVREDIRKQTMQTERATIPITIRQLEALVRVTEAIARIHGSAIATEEHVHEAIRLFGISTIDSAKSGISGAGLLFSEEQQQEMDAIETQIKRRMAIGMTMSQKHIIADIAGMGFSENMVIKSLYMLEKQGVVQAVNERRSITRLL